MLNQFRYHAGQFQVELAEVKFTGDDVVSFLQNQSTFELENFPSHSFHLASFLDPQGRVEAYGWLLKSKDSYSYLIPTLLLESTLLRLNKFLISEDVTISMPTVSKWLVLIGPLAREYSSGAAYAGHIFDEDAFFINAPLIENLPVVSQNEVETWRGLSGWPSFDGSDYSHVIINNLRLYDLSVVPNKGCYPGQETVSKIATRRGAAYSPVLLEVGEILNPGELLSFDKKIGVAHKTFSWEGKFYLAAELLRDFRVEGLKVHFALNGKEHDGFVRYYPLLPGSNKEKAEELFYAGSEHFKKDELKEAEERFRLAIKVDPTFADAYESLGVMLGRLDRYEEAIQLMDKLTAVDPKSVLAHTNKSLFLMKLGRIEEAEEEKSHATIKSFQKFGDEAKQKELEENQKKARASEWAQRESMFEQVLEIDPEDTLANYGIGSIAVEKREWERARKHLERVIIQDSKYSVAYLALGKAYLGLGMKDEAKKTWEEGVKIAASKGDLMPANQMQQELRYL